MPSGPLPSRVRTGLLRAQTVLAEGLLPEGLLPEDLLPAAVIPETVLRRTCAGCRGSRGPWCPACAASLRGPTGRAVLRPHPAGLSAVHAVAAYDGAVREGIVAFKDHGRWRLREPLGQALARAVAAAVLEVAELADERLQAAPGVGHEVVLVPVPGSPGSARLRDGDHVHELAQVASRRLSACGLPTRVEAVLGPVRRRRDQVGLGRSERRINLAGSIAATARAERLREGAVVVVVDDLVTTGATLAEAVRALRAARLRAPAAAVVAAREIGAVPRSPYRS